jgi:hypothetical protein
VGGRGASYTIQLHCPDGIPPDGTPEAAAANAYVPSPVAYLAGNSSVTFVPYELRVAHLALGVTRVRLRADVRNLARNLRQPLLSGEFGSVVRPSSQATRAAAQGRRSWPHVALSSRLIRSDQISLMWPCPRGCPGEGKAVLVARSSRLRLWLIR